MTPFSLEAAGLTDAFHALIPHRAEATRVLDLHGTVLPEQTQEEDTILILIDELAAHAVIERLCSIDWKNNDTHYPSHIALMREYLRRSALWTRALGASDPSPWNDPTTFIRHPNLDFNILPGYTLLSPAPEYPGAGFDPLEDRILALDQLLSTMSLSSLMRQTCVWALRWATLQRQPVVQRFGLPDLYEPLLVLYERGGHFRTEHGQIDFGTVMIAVESVQRRLQRPPLMSFGVEVLNALDRESADLTPPQDLT